MADFPRSSFIPRESTSALPSHVKRRRTFSVLSFLATTMLIGSLLLAGGTYFYKKSTETALIKKQGELNQLKGRFDEGQVAEIRQFDRQLKAAEYLLASHIAPSKIFNALELGTKKRIQFTDFSLEYDPSFEALITVKGATDEFKTVALQALQFGKDPLLGSVAFNEVGTTDVSANQSEGDTAPVHEVTFGITGTIPPALLLYDGGSVPPAQTTEPATAVSDQATGGAVMNNDQ